MAEEKEQVVEEKDEPEVNPEDKEKEKDQPETPKDDPEDKETKQPEVKEETPKADPEVKPEETVEELAEKEPTDLATALVEKDLAYKQATDQYNAEVEKSAGLQTQVDSLEKVVKDLVDSKVSALPEEYKNLLPEGELVNQLDWLNKAESTGLFGKGNPEIEIGKPLDMDKENKVSQAEMSPQQKMSSFFNGFYKK